MSKPRIFPRCGDCMFFEQCSKICIGLDENETFAEIGGCETFQAADDKTKNNTAKSLNE